MYAVGDQRGSIMFPEGRGGRGWSGSADEFRKVKSFYVFTGGDESGSW